MDQEQLVLTRCILQMVCDKAQRDPLGYAEILQRKETNVALADCSNRCGYSERAI